MVVCKGIPEGSAGRFILLLTITGSRELVCVVCGKCLDPQVHWSFSCTKSVHDDAMLDLEN